VRNASRRIQADLHFHSTASDGILTPTQAVERHIRAGNKVLAITDHDSTEGCLEGMQAAARHGVPFLPGVEISARQGGGDIHLLAYAFDLSHKPLQRFLESLRNARLDRVEEILRRLSALGLELTIEEVLAVAGRSSVARPHIAEAMWKKGLVDRKEDAFRDYLGRDKPAFVPVGEVRPIEVIRLVEEAGGVVSLAHPFTENVLDILAICRDAPLWGLEARHAAHNEVLVAQYEDLAAYLGCEVTGGTDDHGHPDSDEFLGTVTLEERVLDFLLDRSRRVLALG
jgi:hypothetical protein